MGSTRRRPAHSVRELRRAAARRSTGSPWRTSRLDRRLRGSSPRPGARLELARLVHVPEGHGDARRQGLGGDLARLGAAAAAGAAGSGRRPPRRAPRGSRRRRRAATPSASVARRAACSGRPVHDDEEGAGGDQLGERLAGAGDGRGLVVEQRAVQVAGEQERPARGGPAAPSGSPQTRPAAGSSTVNRRRRPELRGGDRCPPCASTRARQMARPRPAPGVPRVVLRPVEAVEDERQVDRIHARARRRSR